MTSAVVDTIQTLLTFEPTICMGKERLLSALDLVYPGLLHSLLLYDVIVWSQQTQHRFGDFYLSGPHTRTCIRISTLQ